MNTNSTLTVHPKHKSGFKSRRKTKNKLKGPLERGRIFREHNNRVVFQRKKLSRPKSGMFFRLGQTKARWLVGREERWAARMVGYTGGRCERQAGIGHGVAGFGN